MKKLWLLLIPAVIVGLDQWMKAWTAATLALHETRPLLPGLVRLVHVQNVGAAFGMLGGARWLLILVSSAAVAVAVLAVLKGYVGGVPGLVGTACVVGGALGNLIDRIFQGYVVDMFEFEFVRFAIVNVADVFVTAGGVLLCVYLLFFHDRKPSGDALAGPSPEDEHA